MLLKTVWIRHFYVVKVASLATLIYRFWAPMKFTYFKTIILSFCKDIKFQFSPLTTLCRVVLV